MSTSCDNGSGTNEKLDPENMGIAVVVAMCSRTGDMPGGQITPHLPANVAKNRRRDKD